jgi:repressor LexA
MLEGVIMNNAMNKKEKSKKQKGIASRREEILMRVEESIARKGYPPTVRELLSTLSVKSVSTVHRDIEALKEEGLLSKDPSKPRTLMPTRQAFREGAETVGAGAVNIPIIGQIAAGAPILAEESREGYLPVPERYVRGETFALKVKGDSMIGKGIFDGDFVMIKKQSVANDGDIVVALITDFESEATVKTFYREGRHIRLQPENDLLEPIIVREPEGVQIIGIVIGVFRFM